MCLVPRNVERVLRFPLASTATWEDQKMICMPYYQDINDFSTSPIRWMKQPRYQFPANVTPKGPDLFDKWISYLVFNSISPLSWCWNIGNIDISRREPSSTSTVLAFGPEGLWRDAVSCCAFSLKEADEMSTPAVNARDRSPWTAVLASESLPSKCANVVSNSCLNSLVSIRLPIWLIFE